MKALMLLALVIATVLLVVMAPRGIAAWRRHSAVMRPRPREHAQPIYVIAENAHYRAALAAAQRPDEVRQLSSAGGKNVLCCVFVHADLAWAPHWDLAFRACNNAGLASHGLTVRLRALTAPQAPAAPCPGEGTPEPGVLAGPSALVTAAIGLAGPHRNALAAWRLAVWLELAKEALTKAPYELAYLAGHGFYVGPTEQEHALAWHEAKAAALSERALPSLPHLLMPTSS